MKSIKLRLQYDGTNYAGWQIQKREPSVQGFLEDAVFSITGEEVRVTGAARTDAGVHALDQVAAFHTQSSLEAPVFVRALNAHIPDDIRIIAAEEVHPDFHPRYSAYEKTYSYMISFHGSCSVFLNRYSWVMPHQLDCGAMKAAANHLVGRHDFSSFRASRCSAKNPVREIREIEIVESDFFGFMAFTFHRPIIRISIRANAFLRHMVRNVVGTLVETGRGKFLPETMRSILESRDRSAAGKTAPACGLFLEKIRY